MKFKFNRKEFWASFLMLFIGVSTIVGSQNYQLGTLVRMGPGYFPLMLGVLLTAIALLILFSPESLTEDAEEDGIVLSMGEQIITWTLVIGSVILFIIIGKYGGLVPATFVMCVVAALGDRGNSIKDALLIGVVMSLISAGLFYYGLRIQFPIFTWG